MTRLAGLVLVAALLATGGTVDACSSSGQPSGTASVRPSHAASPAPSPTVMAGCDAALVIVGNIRGELEDAPDQDTFQQANRQLIRLSNDPDTSSDLSLDLLVAATDLARWNFLATIGQAKSADAKAVAKSLEKITEECSA